MGTFEFNEEAARRLEILYSTPDVRGQREEALRQLRLRAVRRSSISDADRAI
jgi:hypothetical protein